MKCILCDLEIPTGKESREHYCCKSRFPKYIWNSPQNIFYAHYMLNAIKANYLPCEFEELKVDLTYKALKYWRLSNEDREFLNKAIDNWQVWNRNPCELCLAKCNERKEIMKQHPIHKHYLKTWAIKNFYQYMIYEIDSNGDKWLQADPLTKGLVCRTAENEQVLRILLENDCINHLKFQQRTR